MWKYMPILKWKQGEQLALRNLSSQQISGVMPLLELQPIDAAPDSQSLNESIPDYMTKVSSQIVKSVQIRDSLCVDASYVSPGYQRQIGLLLTVVGYLQKHLKQGVIPVVHATDLESIEQLSTTSKKVLEKQEKVILRMRTDQIASSQVAASVAIMTKAGIASSKIHLLIDQYSVVGRSPSDCLGQVRSYIDDAMGTGCASVTLAGGSFPVNLVGIQQGLTDLPRIEWMVWKMLVSDDKYKGIIFADYAVTNPAPLPEIDPRQMNASITIRYAAKDFWRLYKGRGFKSKVPGEYRNLCNLLVSDDIYSGEEFSYGDSQYHKKALAGDEKNGTPASWRKEATNHHIALTASCLCS